MKKDDFEKIESKWQNQVDIKGASKPFYNLMMFPYPSAEGLHVGNMYAFTGSDIYGRYMRLKGYDVFEPIGLDGFGIHSENFAIKNKIHPAKMAKKTQKRFYEQLHMIGNAYDWSKTLETYDSDYYKWTQWIFIQMFKRGLAYKKKSAVNWCSSCKTVLSDEQVEAGKCERCKTDVVKKEMSQWFFKITKYAGRLLKNLDKIDWSEKTKLAQKNWIGKSEGAELEFEIKNSKLQIDNKFQILNSVTVFTTRPDTLFGCTYLVLSSESKYIDILKNGIENWSEVEDYIKKAKAKSDLERTNEKTGVELKGIKAINPVNKKEIPIWIADYVLEGYGTGAVMAVPAHDKRDWEFARKFDLKIIPAVIPTGGSMTFKYPDVESGDEIGQRFDKEELDKIMQERAYVGEGKLVNSGEFSGMKSAEAKKEITKFVGGKLKVNYKLRDWCISRQRFWGPPIPIIYCEKCGTVPVDEKDLPVKLPKTDDYLPDGTERSPLARDENFVKTKCPKCGGEAKRETDVSDTFLDSAWYFFRYPCVDDKNEAFDKEITKKWLPVDMYIGGHEHAVLHLLYTRFVTMVFHDMGLIDFEEPFKKFRAHGLIIKDGAKMSKSKGNVINPDEYIEKYGPDVLRTYLMFIGPFKQGGDFRDEGVVGIERFLMTRVKKVVSKIINNKDDFEDISGQSTWIHRTINNVSKDIENLKFNTAIAHLMVQFDGKDGKPDWRGKMEFDGTFEDKKCDFIALEKFLILLSPFAPYLCEELWEMLGHKESVFRARWPELDESKIKDEKINLVIQVNGKVRATVEVDVEISEEEARKIAIEQENVKKYVEGKEENMRTIFVKGKLLNIVI